MKPKNLVALSCLALLSGVASAHYPYTFAECKQLGGLVQGIAVARDAGVSQDQMNSNVLSMINEAMKDTTLTFIKDRADAENAYGSIEVVYNRPKDNPVVLRDDSTSACLKILVPSLKTIKFKEPL